jgi:hypothetical protein
MDDGSGSASDDDDGEQDDGSGDNGELTILNESEFVIEQVFVAEAGSDLGGQNLAPDGGIPPDDRQSIVLTCGLYDLLLIDEDEVDCDLYDLDICADADTVVVENNDCFVESFDGTVRALGGE